MSKKIVIEKCMDCPHVETEYFARGSVIKNWYWCKMNSNEEEFIDPDSIPEWCSLENNIHSI